MLKQIPICLFLADADNIAKVYITNQTMDSITITWDPPQDPNGVISHYSVEYKRIDIENVSINFNITSENGHYIKKLPKKSRRICKLISENANLSSELHCV